MFNHYAKTPLQNGGTRHFSLAHELVSRGHEVTIVAASSNSHNSQLMSPTDDSVQPEMVDGVRFLWVRTPSYHDDKTRVWNMLIFAYRIWREVGLLGIDKADVIIGSSVHPFTPLVSERIARRYGIPFVLEIRDLWPESLIEIGQYSRLHPFIALLSVIERRLYRVSDWIISVLPMAFEYMEKRGAKIEQITYIPNGIDFNLVPAIEPVVEHHPFTVLYAGTLNQANGLWVIIEAADILKQTDKSEDICFQIMGEGVLRKDLERAIQERNLPNVHLLPAVPKSGVYSTLKQADAFIVSSLVTPLYKYGISFNKLFDYFAMARPILFGVDSPFDPVSDSGSGLPFSAQNAKELVKAVLKLSSMSVNDRQKMGQRGREYVEQNHDFHLLSCRLENVLQKVIQNNNDSK